MTTSIWASHAVFLSASIEEHLKSVLRAVKGERDGLKLSAFRFSTIRD